MATNFLLIFFALFGFAFSEIIPYEDCGNHNVCEVNELHITPCKNQTLKKGSSVSVAFDFTPKFSSDSILTGLLWYNDDFKNTNSELPNGDGCLYTSCPLVANKKQTLSYNLDIANRLPNGKYYFKWKVWSNDKECCLETTIDLK